MGCKQSSAIKAESNQQGDGQDNSSQHSENDHEDTQYVVAGNGEPNENPEPLPDETHSENEGDKDEGSGSGKEQSEGAFGVSIRKSDPVVCVSTKFFILPGQKGANVTEQSNHITTKSAEVSSRLIAIVPLITKITKTNLVITVFSFKPHMLASVNHRTPSYSKLTIRLGFCHYSIAVSLSSSLSSINENATDEDNLNLVGVLWKTNQLIQTDLTNLSNTVDSEATKPNFKKAYRNRFCVRVTVATHPFTAKCPVCFLYHLRSGSVHKRPWISPIKYLHALSVVSGVIFRVALSSGYSRVDNQKYETSDTSHLYYWLSQPPPVMFHTCFFGDLNCKYAPEHPGNYTYSSPTTIRASKMPLHITSSMTEFCCISETRVYGPSKFAISPQATAHVLLSVTICTEPRYILIGATCTASQCLLGAPVPDKTSCRFQCYAFQLRFRQLCCATITDAPLVSPASCVHNRWDCGSRFITRFGDDYHRETLGFLGHQRHAVGRLGCAHRLLFVKDTNRHQRARRVKSTDKSPPNTTGNLEGGTCLECLRCRREHSSPTVSRKCWEWDRRQSVEDLVQVRDEHIEIS
ncbi:hypothetical protein CSKR_107993 [Clonorchis sinensis]|uniref:Uncharacterized protein n=1 Tax=Clonorchis sinensis TaxID=79923 RepID=A0A8T1M9A2_CLOSI|nr:hypothetical protein CSKR_107993 [Clonorchis sinensis]